MGKPQPARVQVAIVQPAPPAATPRNVPAATPAVTVPNPFGDGEIEFDLRQRPLDRLLDDFDALGDELVERATAVVGLQEDGVAVALGDERVDQLTVLVIFSTKFSVNGFDLCLVAGTHRRQERKPARWAAAAVGKNRTLRANGSRTGQLGRQ